MDSSSPSSNSDPLRPDRPSLPDRWARGGQLLLDGPLEGGRGASTATTFVTGILGLGAAFILFQLVVSPALLVLQIGMSEGGVGALETMGDPSALLSAYTQELIVSNSVGQVFGLVLPALLMARLHTSRLSGFLRLRGVDARFLVLAVIGIVGLQPVVQWLAQINRHLPLPEAVRMFEQTQLELIQAVLESGVGVSFNLVMLAIIPGFCEEVLFRGYAQRQFERATGPIGGILLSGLLFGAYHLRPTQLLPLVGLGLFLAYLTWRTGSLWPAVIVHMVHNGLAVLAARYVETHESYDLDTLEQAPMPWYAVVTGFAIFVGVLYVLHPLAHRVRDA